MDNSVIKIMLERKMPRVYSLIVQLYFDKIEMYKTSVFKVWLAEQIGVDPSLIHDASITAAMARHRKKKAKAKQPTKGNTDTSIFETFNTEIPEVFPGFK
ncbi:MAG: hypothetical protein ACKOEV_04735 [Cytophagales bacterium]